MLLGIAGLFVALFTGLMLQRKLQRTAEQRRLEAELRLPDTLRVVTLSGATTFFTYKDEPMGYQYELVRLFAEEQGLPMELFVAHHMDEAVALVRSGKADLCITPHAVTRSSKDELRFAGPEELSGLVLVQRRRAAGTDSTHYIRNVSELLGRPVTVLRGTRAADRIRHLEAQLGGPIKLALIDSDTTNSEDLIDQVATHKIDYTIIDQELARLAKTYYPNIDVSLEVGFKQRLRWFPSPERRGLAEALDRWAAQLPRQDEASEIYRRYFELNKSELPEEEPHQLPKTLTDNKRYRWRGELAHIHEGGISPFDHIFQHEAKRIGWPWQLLASIAYQESNFKPHIVGWSGARGLMGIMPRTGRIYGASPEQLLDPQVSVRVAVDCLLATERIFKSIPAGDNRLRITLAAYNAGPAHLEDVLRLSAKYRKGGHDWDEDIEPLLHLKSEAKYYNDPVCRAGYLRGKSVARYVDQVMSRYQLYKSKGTKIPEEGKRHGLD